MYNLKLLGLNNCFYTTQFYTKYTPVLSSFYVIHTGRCLLQHRGNKNHLSVGVYDTSYQPPHIHTPTSSHPNIIIRKAVVLIYPIISKNRYNKVIELKIYIQSLSKLDPTKTAWHSVLCICNTFYSIKTLLKSFLEPNQIWWVGRP